MNKNWLFENVRVLRDDFTFADASVAVRDGVIAEIGRPDGAGLQKIDGAGRLLVPGLIDTHFHGALGNCFGRTGPEGIREVAAFEAKQGVTAIVPAVSATTDENVLDTLRSIRMVMASSRSMASSNVDGFILTSIKIAKLSSRQGPGF